MAGFFGGSGGGNPGQQTDAFGNPINTSSPDVVNATQDWLSGWDPNSYLSGAQQQYGGQPGGGGGDGGGGGTDG